LREVAGDAELDRVRREYRVRGAKWHRVAVRVRGQRDERQEGAMRTRRALGVGGNHELDHRRKARDGLARIGEHDVADPTAVGDRRDVQPTLALRGMGARDPERSRTYDPAFEAPESPRGTRPQQDLPGAARLDGEHAGGVPRPERVEERRHAGRAVAYRWH